MHVNKFHQLKFAKCKKSSFILIPVKMSGTFFSKLYMILNCTTHWAQSILLEYQENDQSPGIRCEETFAFISSNACQTKESTFGPVSEVDPDE